MFALHTTKEYIRLMAIFKRLMIKVDHRKRKIWQHYVQFFKFLNINPHSKPVLLFIITILSIGLSSFTFYSIKILNLIKPKIGAIMQLQLKRQSASTSRLNLKNYSFFSSREKEKERVIYVPYKNKFIKVSIPTTSSKNDKYEQHKLILKKFMKENERNLKTKGSSAIQFQFFEKIYIIWNLILVPKVFDKNSYLLLSQVAFLIARTWMTLLVTKLDGQIMKDLMSFNIKYFLRDMVYWFLFAVPASYVNAAIKFLSRRLSLNFRTNLIRYCHDLYMDSRLSYYKLQYNKHELKEYELAHEQFDQYITEDIKKFCDSITNLLTNVGKPTVDLIFFAFYLRDNIGNLGIFGIFANYLITGMILRNQSPNFSKIWKTKTFLQGIYYNYNINLINNCEEISFYKGIAFERSKVGEIFSRLINHCKYEINEKFRYQLLEDYILKSVWPAFGYLFAGLPILMDQNYSSDSNAAGLSSGNIKSFTVNKRLILSMADAGSRLMYSIKDISRLNGITDRIFTLLVNLHQTHDSGFQYGYSNSKPTGGFGSTFQLGSFAMASRTKLKSLGSMVSDHYETGTIQLNYPGVRLESADVIPPSYLGPNGSPLLQNVNFHIPLPITSLFDTSGCNLLIHGGNGSGKTSIIRLMSELWPLYTGLLSKPNNQDVMFVSQRPYFVHGTLKDQVIYPLNWDECVERGLADRVEEVLADVGLDYLVNRVGLDWNPAEKVDENYDHDGSEQKNSGPLLHTLIKDNIEYPIYSSYLPGPLSTSSWEKFLSGGERQKLIFARVLFHQKKLVVLDEPTSAISYDYEDILFGLLKKKNICVITVSSRQSLRRWHDWILELKDGKTSFVKIDESLKSFNGLDKEVEYLKIEMEKMEALKQRRQKLVGLLDGIEV